MSGSKEKRMKHGETKIGKGIPFRVRATDKLEIISLHQSQEKKKTRKI